MPKRPTSIDLRELAVSKGRRVHRVVQVDTEPILLSGQRYAVVMGRDDVHVTIDRVAGGFLVALEFEASVYGPCFRCLREAGLHVHAAQEEFVPLRPEEWDVDDVSPFVRDLVVDVAALAREALVLALPDKILCEEGCPGVCPSCGRAAHEGACEGVVPLRDPRWAKLGEMVFEEGDDALKSDAG